ncbi:MAG: hypothetical protein R3C25_08110 [Hyphomonadaceae bacterium]
MIAFEQNTSGDGGDSGFAGGERPLPRCCAELENASLGALIGPIEIEGHWLLVQLLDRQARGVPSLETLRPRIIDWLRYQEIDAA